MIVIRWMHMMREQREGFSLVLTAVNMYYILTAVNMYYILTVIL